MPEITLGQVEAEDLVTSAKSETSLVVDDQEQSFDLKQSEEELIEEINNQTDKTEEISSEEDEIIESQILQDNLIEDSDLKKISAELEQVENFTHFAEKLNELKEEINNLETQAEASDLGKDIGDNTERKSVKFNELVDVIELDENNTLLSETLAPLTDSEKLQEEEESQLTEASDSEIDPDLEFISSQVQKAESFENIDVTEVKPTEAFEEILQDPINITQVEDEQTSTVLQNAFDFTDLHPEHGHDVQKHESFEIKNLNLDDDYEKNFERVIKKAEEVGSDEDIRRISTALQNMSSFSDLTTGDDSYEVVNASPDSEPVLIEQPDK